MEIPFGDLSRQYKKYKKDFDRITENVFLAGNFILGENVERFEEEFAGYCNARFAAGVGSGTEAIQLALLACGINPGDQVITVANTAIPTIAAIRAAGAIPVFVDIEPDTFHMDPSLIEEKIGEKTRAIVPVHLYGNPCKMDEITGIAKRYGLKIIEDCAQAHGAIYMGKKIGTSGDAGAFSFYPSKNLGAFGDGGMVITSDEVVAKNLKLLRNYGQSSRYKSVIEGYNSRLDELQAAILRFKLRFLDKWNSRRIEIAGKYSSAFSGTAVICPRVSRGTKHVFHLYVIRIKNRNKLMDHLENHGIKTLIHYPVPLHLQESYKNLGYSRGDFPVTEDICNHILSIPVYPELEEKEINYIIAKILLFFKG